ncbi:hypothetical protein [Streptomyces sp. NPDC056661]|uniref:hypothetical protein n=1 Tax=Streptomyces sp. NPDC056661 TaxID=3345898 RepID=UPI0036BB4554
MEFVFTQPTLVVYADIAALTGVQRQQLMLHCRNYTGEQAHDAAEALMRIAEFGGDEPLTYDCLHRWRVVAAHQPRTPVFDAWIDIDAGTVFEAGTTSEARVHLAECHFHDASGALSGAELAAALDRAFAKALHQAPYVLWHGSY